MRYAPAEDLLRLARHLALNRTGLTLNEMAEKLGASRRKVERLRDTLAAVFPELEYADDTSRNRRWYLPRHTLNNLVHVPPAALAAVEVAARDAALAGEATRAAQLRAAAEMLRFATLPQNPNGMEEDIAAMMEAEGTAMRPGPRPRIPPALVGDLREAILSRRLVRARYRPAAATRTATRELCPYGILYGEAGHLVANMNGRPGMGLWRLDRFEAWEVLKKGFVRRPDFNLSAYAAQSFGIYQGDTVDVVLRFVPEAAHDALNWHFHPSQTFTPEPDGSLIVRFRASGQLAMCWHLFTWGRSVTVVQPVSLRQRLTELSNAVASHHAGGIPR